MAMALLICGAAARAEPAIASPRDNASAPDHIASIVEEAAQRFGVPEAWIRAVMQVESNSEVHALSSKGAIGLMQIMPQTWAGLRARYNLGADPYDAHDNIVAGSAYLRELWDRYGAPGFLAAYNAGPARYEDHLASGRALPAETQVYVARLAPALNGGANIGVIVNASMVRPWTEAPLFTSDAAHPNDVSARLGSEAATRLAVGVDGVPAAFVSRPDGLFIATPGERSRP
jgi:soluble lytic murein transglycosylase-like protein